MTRDIAYLEVFELVDLILFYFLQKDPFYVSFFVQARAGG